MTINGTMDTLVETGVKLTKYMDPKNDYAFKRLFGSKCFERLTIHFINDCLAKTGEDKIVQVYFLPTILEADVLLGKQCIVDVMCQDRKGDRFVVEMQVDGPKGFVKRIQYYCAKAYIHQLKQGESYEVLKKVSLIVIADFIPFPSKENYKTIYRNLDIETLENDLDGMEQIVIALPKLKEKLSQLPQEGLKILTPIEKWCYFFIYATEITDEELVTQQLVKIKSFKKRLKLLGATYGARKS